MGNNCDAYLQPQPEPIAEYGLIAEDCPPNESPEPEPEPEPEGSQQQGTMVLSDCKGGDLGNYTFDGCVQIMLDMNKLCVALNIHAYVFGALFVLLVITACFALYPLIIKKRSSNPSFMITINILVIIFGILRSLYLLIDAYGLKGYYRSVGALLFADLAIPCLTSAFALVQWAFLELLQVRRINDALQSPRVLIAIVASHFIFVAVIDFLLFYVGKGVCFLMTVCQAVNVLWGLILTFGFLYTTQKLFKRDKEHRSTLRKSQVTLSNKHSTVKKPRDSSVKSMNNSIRNERHGLITKSHNNSVRIDEKAYIQTVSGKQSNTHNIDVEKQNGLNSAHMEANVSETNTDASDVNTAPEVDMTEEDPIILRPLKRLRNTLSKGLSRSAKRRQKSYLTKVKNVGIFTTINGLALFGVSLYGIIAIYNPFDGAPTPGDWGWYIFQTLHRTLELGFGFTMVYLSWSRNKG